VSDFRLWSVDPQLMETAYTEGRILLTEDKDVGWLAFAGHMDNPGVVLIRFPGYCPTHAGSIDHAAGE